MTASAWLRCAALLVLLILAGMRHARAQSSREALGVNVSMLTDYATQLVYVDAFKSARGWIPQLADDFVWDTGEPLSLDENGWVRELAPGQAAGTILLTNEGHFPTGTYTLLYEGEGTIEVNWDPVNMVAEPGRIVFDIDDPDEGIYLKLTATNPDDYVRNVRVLLPGHAETYAEQPFFPPFLEMLEPFGVLRFMWWGNVPDSEVETWEDRTPPNYYTYQAAAGAPYEAMIELANAAGADPWICVPHLADDNHVRRLAELVRDRLDPDLRVYIEHSNEVWNGIYSGLWWARDRAEELGLIEDGDWFTGAMRVHSMRSVHIFQIFEDVFGGTDRLVRVMGGWSGNAFHTEVLLGHEDAYRHTDAFAVAPYFGGDFGHRPEAVDYTVDQLLDSVEVDLDRQLAQNHDVREVAASFGVDLITYESGQHLAGFLFEDPDLQARITDLFIEANRHPRMYDIYTDFLQRWHDEFGGMNVLYALCEPVSEFGMWGLLEAWDRQDPAEAPKWNAVIDFAAGLAATAVDHPERPAEVRLLSAAPNPFVDRLTLHVTLESTAAVRADLFDALGRRVARISFVVLPPGEHALEVGTDGLAPGLYLYRAAVGDRVVHGTAIRVR